MEPGSAVSAQLVRGDLEIAATCTVTYIDPKQLLACGHPILQAGPVSLPMTTAEETGLSTAIRGATRLRRNRTASMTASMPWPQIFHEP